MSMSLPGSHVTPENGELEQNPCGGVNNEKCGKPSEHKLIGESDSFGDEYFYCCTECLEKLRKWEKENPPTGTCDYCKGANLLLVKYRDLEEGMHGRVYDVCRPCRDKHTAYLLEDAHDDDDDHIDFEPDDIDDEPLEPKTKGYSALATYQDKLWSVSYNPEQHHARLHAYDPTAQYPQYIVNDPADIAVLIAVLEEDAVTFDTDGTDGLIPRSDIRFHLEEILE